MNDVIKINKKILCSRSDRKIIKLDKGAQASKTPDCMRKAARERERKKTAPAASIGMDFALVSEEEEEVIYDKKN